MPYAGMAELADALDLGSSGQPCGFDSHYPYHVGAKFALLRRLFMPEAKKMSFAYFLAPPFQPQLAALGSQLADRPVGGTFLHYEISALSVPSTSE